MAWFGGLLFDFASGSSGSSHCGVSVIVASAILAYVEPGLPARRISVATDETLINPKRFAQRRLFPGGRMPPSTAGKDACRHIFKQALCRDCDPQGSVQYHVIRGSLYCGISSMALILGFSMLETKVTKNFPSVTATGTDST
jgi:hypothetical protein